MTLLVNVIAFQLGWFACVLGAAYERPWLGTAAALAIVALHVARAARPLDELALVLIAGALGAVFDSAIAALGWIHYPHGTLIAGVAPHWMVALWMLFATTLNVSLAWLKGRDALAALFGLIGGPLAYVGGGKLGALVIVEWVPALAALALGWAILTPLLMRVARRFDGIAPRKEPMSAREVSHA